MAQATINDTGEQLIGFVNEALGQTVATTSDTGETLIGHVNDAIGVAGTATVNDTGEQLIQHVNDALDKQTTPSTIRVMAYNVATFTVGTNSNSEQIDGNGYYSNGDPGYYTGGTIQRQGAYNERYNAWTNLLDAIKPDVLATVEHNDVFSKVGGVDQTAASTILSGFDAKHNITGWGLLNKGVFSTLVKSFPAGTVNTYTFASDMELSPDDRRCYVTAEIKVGSVKVMFALAHLVFSPNNMGMDTYTQRRYAQMDELMSVCANYDHAVILGDFNILNANEYQRFVNAGFVCANDGTLPTYNGTLVISSGSRALDNIIVKGFTISNVTVPDAAIYRQINGDSVRYPLSDHNPIWCDLTFVEEGEE